MKETTRILIPQDKVEERIQQLADEISRDYEGKVLLILNTATGSGVSASFFVTSGSLKYKEILRQPSSVCYY